MYILGINAYHGDASAAILSDGQLIAAAEEERFTRIKHCAGFPFHAVRYCVKEAGINPEEITHIAIARDSMARIPQKALYAIKIPRLAFNRLIAHGKFAMVKSEMAEALNIDPSKLRAEVHRVEHHKAHLASSFFVCQFEEAALLSVDGFGDFASTMWGIGRGNRMIIRGAVPFPHSLGIFYTAITQYLGFPKYGDEYKVMGLAGCGEPEFKDEFERILRLEDRVSKNGNLDFNLGLEYFVHHKTGAEMTWGQGEPILGKLYSDLLERRIAPGRKPGSTIQRIHENIAASLQARLEDAIFFLLNRLYKLYPVNKLCLAGGVAFNCVANGKIFEKTPFEQVFIPPAAGDAGLAIGSAYYVYHQLLNFPRSFQMEHAYWGPEFSHQEILNSVDGNKLSIEELASQELVMKTAKLIADGKVVGWFQGRMEWGPRALGNRSIVVDPRRQEMKDILNSRIKHREPFRPFAPSVLQERVADYFEQSHPSPFMLMTYKVKREKIHEIPAPTHVDGTARVQTVTSSANPLYWGLIKEFENLTGVPVLLNTSFNENEPIVCTPQEAISCFLRTKMDVLVMGNYLIRNRCFTNTLTSESIMSL